MPDTQLGKEHADLGAFGPTSRGIRGKVISQKGGEDPLAPHWA